MLVSLGLLGLWQPGLRVVGHLHLQWGVRAPGPVGAARVPRFLWLQGWPDPLPPPLDQGHAVADGLGHNLHVALVEEPRLDLQRMSAVTAGPVPTHTASCSLGRQHPLWGP